MARVERGCLAHGVLGRDEHAGLLEAGEVRKLTVGKQKPNTAGRRTFFWDMTQKGGKKFKKVLALG